jgi:hypothetical protein
MTETGAPEAIKYGTLESPHRSGDRNERRRAFPWSCEFMVLLTAEEMFNSGSGAGCGGIA